MRDSWGYYTTGVKFTQIQEADLSYPLHILFFKGRPLILDGLHRLTKAVLTGRKIISVKVVTMEQIDPQTEATREHF